jgi:hypothetical protein
MREWCAAGAAGARGRRAGRRAERGGRRAAAVAAVGASPGPARRHLHAPAARQLRRRGLLQGSLPTSASLPSTLLLDDVAPTRITYGASRACIVEKKLTELAFLLTL